MRIFDQANRVAEWIRERYHFDRVTHVSNRRANCGARRDEVISSPIDVGHSPVCETAAGPRPVPRRIGLKPQLVAGDIESNVERLIKIRLLLKCGGVPRFRALQVADTVDDCRKAQNHVERSSPRRRSEHLTTTKVENKSWMECGIAHVRRVLADAYIRDSARTSTQVVAPINNEPR